MQKQLKLVGNIRNCFFKDLVLRLVTFHTMGVFLAVIGHRFGAAGLRDIVIKSKVIESQNGQSEKLSTEGIITASANLNEPNSSG